MARTRFHTVQRPEKRNPFQTHQPTKLEAAGMPQVTHVLPTPVKHNVLDCILEGYDCKSKGAPILGFQSGFIILFSIDTDPQRRDYENHKFVNVSVSLVQAKLDKEKA